MNYEIGIMNKNPPLPPFKKGGTIQCLAIIGAMNTSQPPPNPSSLEGN